jgi:hypothetical protein
MDRAELERQYFARGKEICGNSAGGLLARLLKAKGGDIALARAAAEMAATKQDPREYLSKLARPAATGAVGNGAAERLNEAARRQLAARERDQKRAPTAEQKARVAEAHAKFKAAVPPEDDDDRMNEAMRLGARADKLAASTLEEKIDDWDVWP